MFEVECVQEVMSNIACKKFMRNKKAPTDLVGALCRLDRGTVQCMPYGMKTVTFLPLAAISAETLSTGMTSMHLARQW